MTKYGSMFKRPSRGVTHQSVSTPLEGYKDKQVLNDAGGYTFAVSDMDAAKRFLIFGSETNTYYVNAQTLTIRHAETIVRLVKAGMGWKLVEMIVDVNSNHKDENGNLIQAAARQKSPSIFALAIVKALAKDEKTIAALYAAIRGRVVISTLRQMYEFLGAVYQITNTGMKDGKFDGRMPFGSGMKRALRDWLLGDGSKDKDQADRWIAMQFAKYRAASYNVVYNDGTSFWDTENQSKKLSINIRDVLRLSHVKPNSPASEAVFHWATFEGETGDWAEAAKAKVRASWGDNASLESTPAWEYIMAFEEVSKTDNVDRICELINKIGLTWEMIPNHWFSDIQADARKKIWRALIGLNNAKYDMGFTALLRNLRRISEYGVLMDRDAVDFVVDKISGPNSAALMKLARVHPISIYMALSAYRELPYRNNMVLDALYSAFENSFANVQPIGVKTLFAYDMSGSMGVNNIKGQNTTAAEVAAVLGMINAKVEPDYLHIGFDTSKREVPFNRRTSLKEAEQFMQRFVGGGTDCSVPFRWMVSADSPKDVGYVVVYTDSEHWSGFHVDPIVDEYRSKYNPDLRVCWVQMTGSTSSLKTPDKLYHLEVLGFDANAPEVISSFGRNGLM